MTKLTLVSFPTCPFVQRAVIALREKGVPHEVIYIDLAHKPDWFLDISPLGKVPLLQVEEDGGPPVVLFESAVIAEYLDEISPGERLLPSNPLERAGHRAWIEFASQLLADNWKLTTASTPAELDTNIAAVAGKLARLEPLVAGPYFAGKKFGLVDAAFAPAFRQLDVLEAAISTALFTGLPNVDGWRRHLAARLSVQEAAPKDFAERYLDRIRKSNGVILGRAAA